MLYDTALEQKFASNHALPVQHTPPHHIHALEVEVRVGLLYLGRKQTSGTGIGNARTDCHLNAVMTKFSVQAVPMTSLLAHIPAYTLVCSLVAVDT